MGAMGRKARPVEMAGTGGMGRRGKLDLYYIAMKCCNLIGQIKVFKSLIPPVIALIPPLIYLYHL